MEVLALLLHNRQRKPSIRPGSEIEMLGSGGEMQVSWEFRDSSHG
jgi:hypothetical protein